jgi:hypothetical protein
MIFLLEIKTATKSPKAGVMENVFLHIIVFYVFILAFGDVRFCVNMLAFGN